MNTIHPTAIIDPTTALGDDNVIGPFVVIEGRTRIGSRNRIEARAFIAEGTTLGDDNLVAMGAVLGYRPQDLAYAGDPTETRIGSGNTIREYVTVHRGTKPGTATAIGDRCFLMATAHVAHNCRIGNGVTMANAATLAGYCQVGDGAFLSGLTVCHQFVRIGRLAMIGGMSAVGKDVPPFMTVAGRPAVVQGVNTVGMRREGMGAEARGQAKNAYKLLYKNELNVSQALERIRAEFPGFPQVVQEIVEFVTSSERGICAGSVGAQETITSRMSRSKMALTAEK